MDSYWGGKNDLIAAVGFEKDGVTTIAFRKKLKGEKTCSYNITSFIHLKIYALLSLFDSNEMLFVSL